MAEPMNESYHPDPKVPQPELEPAELVPPTQEALVLQPNQFRTIQSPMISDPDDTTGARCFAPGPNVQAEGKTVNLPCIRRRGHVERGEKAHRSMAGEHPESRVFYEW
jgi:hypothetical protein